MVVSDGSPEPVGEKFCAAPVCEFVNCGVWKDTVLVFDPTPSTNVVLLAGPGFGPSGM